MQGRELPAALARRMAGRSLGISGSTVDVLTRRSTDSWLTWNNPVPAATGSNDKD